MNPEAVGRMMLPLARRLRLMVARAVVQLVDDTTLAQALQIDLFAGETAEAVERFQNYGFTSVPHPGAEAAVIFVGGARSHGIVVAVEDRRYRLKGLQAGEVALYDDLGNIVKLGREALDITAVTKAVVTAPIVAVYSPDVRLGGDGGKAVARVGDHVDLSTGKILTGSAKVTAT